MIPSLPFAATVDTSEATFAADDPFSCGVATVWYSFTPQTSGEYAARASAPRYTRSSPSADARTATSATAPPAPTWS